MIDYLINYGIQKHTMDYDDIDINDRLALQDQINLVRRNYSKLLKLLDDVQSKYLDCTAKISKRSKEIINSTQSNRNSAFSSDDAYIELDIELQALKSGMNMVNAQIDYCKNDLRILNSVFYNKF